MVQKRLLGRAYFGVHLDIKALLTEQIFLMKKLVHQFNLLHQMEPYSVFRPKGTIVSIKMQQTQDNVSGTITLDFLIMQM
ncbi:Uncharacterised protein [Mycobacteroides abscessus]|nr:Uncharacterised protein [Mycobacteroides abscessus]